MHSEQTREPPAQRPFPLQQMHHQAQKMKPAVYYPRLDPAMKGRRTRWTAVPPQLRPPPTARLKNRGKRSLTIASQTSQQKAKMPLLWLPHRRRRGHLAASPPRIRPVLPLIAPHQSSIGHQRDLMTFLQWNRKRFCVYCRCDAVKSRENHSTARFPKAQIHGYALFNNARNVSDSKSFRGGANNMHKHAESFMDEAISLAVLAPARGPLGPCPDPDHHRRACSCYRRPVFTIQNWSMTGSVPTSAAIAAWISSSGRCCPAVRYERPVAPTPAAFARCGARSSRARSAASVPLCSQIHCAWLAL